MAELLISILTISHCSNSNKDEAISLKNHICNQLQFWIQPNPKLKENWNIKTLLYCFCSMILCFCVILYLYVIFRHRSKPPRSRIHSNVDKNKIIFAFEIEKLFFRYKNTKQNGYLPIKFPQDQPTPIFQKLASYLGYGHYYKRNFDLLKIKQFLSAVQSIPRVQIYIYTHLPQKIASALLKQMKLDEYFPQEKRRYMSHWNSDMSKHAIQVDNESRRVIIITPTNQNHSQDDEKYFLVLNPANNNAVFLREAQYIIQKIVRNNRSIDNLHEELERIKIQLQ